MNMKNFTGSLVSRRKLISLIITAQVLLYFGIFGSKHLFTTTYKHTPIRGVIATLIRSTDRSIFSAINMIHSVTQFHSTSDGHPYPFLIFHDQSFTASMREQILSCVIKENSQINISFAQIDFPTSLLLIDGSRMEITGYRFVCRFWTYDVFYHPAVTEGGYEYLMRMDDDSYFSDATKIDLFLHMQRQKLDYTYRAVYQNQEQITSMKFILKRFFNDKPVFSDCIYNNFFIIRLKWYHESKAVQSFVSELIKDNLMFREYIVDGCVHAAMLKIDNHVKVKPITDFSYGHNFHVIPWRSSRVIFKQVEEFEEQLMKSCKQLTILRGAKGILTKINIL